MRQLVTDFFLSRDMLKGVTAGLIVALLIYLFSNLPTWRANWSEKAAEKRAKQLRDELQKIDELRDDLSQYVGFLIGDVAKLLVAFAWSIMNLVMWDGTRHLPVYSDWLLRLESG
jgi:hypothetical protein